MACDSMAGMAIIYGQRPYGKCDVVPELFYVATWFFHVDYLPLFPTGSNLVFGKVGDQYRVVKIPMSAKSVLLAWGRIGTFIAAVATIIAAISEYGSDHGSTQDALGFATLALLSVTAYAFLMIYFRRRMPSYERAGKLAQLAGLSDKAWAALNVLYGRDPFDRAGKFAAVLVFKLIS